MRPVRTERSTMILRGDGDQVMDMWAHVEDGAVMTVWTLDDDERRFLLDGGNIELGVYCGPSFPPVRLAVTGAQEAGK